MSNHTMDKDDSRIEIAISKGDQHIEFELATNTIEEFKDIIMSMAQVVGFDENAIEKHFNYQYEREQEQ